MSLKFDLELLYHIPRGKKATIHQVTTMLATSKYVLFPGHYHCANHWYWWPDITLTGTQVITKVSGLQFGWLAWWLWPGNRTFWEVASIMVTWWIMTFLRRVLLSAHLNSFSNVCMKFCTFHRSLRWQKDRYIYILTLKVLVATIDAQWEGMGDVGSVRYEPALLPPCPTIRVLSYSN